MPLSTAYDIKGNGPAVVLIHGLGLNRRMWQWQLDALTPHFKVVQYDLLGHGESAKPPGPYLMPQMVQQIEDLLNETGIDKAALVGFSLGGMIGQAFSLAYQDKVTALALLNTAHGRSDQERESIMQRVQQAQEAGPEATVDAALKRWFTESFAAEHTDLLAKVRQWVVANDPAIYPSLYKLLAEADIELDGSIARISCATLIVTGEEDYGNSPQMAQQMAARIPHAELQILPGLRHMALAEDPATMNALLVSFLRENLEK